MRSWAAEELRTVDLGDARRERRLVRLVEDLAEHPTGSVPHACGDWATTKAAYRFWDCDAVAPSAIREAHIEASAARVAAAERVLVLQDTTTLDFSAHPATAGLGPIEHPAHQGLLVHSALAVTLGGVPLGLMDQQVWARDPHTTGTRHTRRQRPTAAKESQKWLTTQTASQAAIADDVGIITVADREADIYDLFAQPRRAGSDLLVRAAHNRRVTHEARYLWEAVRASPLLGRHTVTVGRRTGQSPRDAHLTLRAVSLALLPPRHHQQRAACQPVPVSLVLAEEETPPAGVTPLRWLLITTLPVTTLAEATSCLDWYALRWLIERYHYVLKSGCRIEQLQLGTVERLQRALATYGIVAWRLLWLTYLARVAPETPADTVLEADEWRALSCAHHRQREPAPEPPTLAEAVRWIAQLGGFLGRRHDGEPGVQTIWRGLMRLADLTDMYRLLHSPTLPE
jgi:hypothetical protein